MIRVLDKIALSGMTLGLLLLLFPLLRLAGACEDIAALEFVSKAATAMAKPVVFKTGFFLTLIATVFHIFTSHMVKPKETDA